MKFKKTIGVLLLISILLGMMALPFSVSANTQTYAQKFLDEQLEKYNISGVAYVTQKGKVIAQSVRGMANTDEGKENTIDTLFPIGSISKQFCAVAVFMLKEQGMLSLDDTLSEYFPEYTVAKDVTIKQMLTMRSGIRDFQEGAFTEFFLSIDNTQEENQQIMLEWLCNKSLMFKPGSKYTYSNTNTLLLSMIIEQLTGDDYEDFLKANIFAPLGMDNTGFYEELVNHPDLCENKFPDIPDIVLPTDTKGCFQGCGDLVSNAKDMDKWLTSLRECRLISEESMAEMLTVCSKNTEYTNGVSVGYAHSLKITGDNGVGHTGFIVTYASGALTYFEDEFNVFVVTNDEENIKIATLDLVHKIAKELKNQKLYGDVDGDFDVNVKDATMIQKASAKLVELSDKESLCADVNMDESVNIKDATVIQKHIAKLETNLSVGDLIK